MLNGPNVNQNELRKAQFLNAQTLQQELEWFSAVLEARIAQYAHHSDVELLQEVVPQKEAKPARSSWWNPGKVDKHDKEDQAAVLTLPSGKPQSIKTPEIRDNDSHYARFVRKYDLVTDERLILMLALAPHLQPQVLDCLLSIGKTHGIGGAMIGGVNGVMHRGFLPTIETALFLLAGENLDYRLLVEELFYPKHCLLADNIIELSSPPATEPYHASALKLSEEALSQILYGCSWEPRFSADFPAKPLTTTFVWEELILNDHIKTQLDHIHKWLKHMDNWPNDASQQAQFTELRQVIPGYRAIFLGPSGTGKTLAAALLGKKSKRNVYRIDLSMVVSKYIGETEKNLGKVFAMAESRKNWILFFDEADALFGKRTNISDAHDRYANQDISYLLQRLEDYPGLVILASNMQHNIDDAFIRRMQSVIHFNRPDQDERQQIWEKALKIGGVQLEADQIRSLAVEYDLTGAAIMNALHYAIVEAQGVRQEVEEPYDQLENNGPLELTQQHRQKRRRQRWPPASGPVLTGLSRSRYCSTRMRCFGGFWTILSSRSQLVLPLAKPDVAYA